MKPMWNGYRWAWDIYRLDTSFLQNAKPVQLPDLSKKSTLKRELLIVAPLAERPASTG